MPEFSLTWPIIDKGGVIAICVLLVIAFIRGWIVPRYVYNGVVKDMEFFRTAALRGTELADRAIVVAEKKVSERDTH